MQLVQKPTSPPFRPLFLTAIGLGIAGKALAGATDSQIVLWLCVVLGVALGGIDTFRWLHQMALYETQDFRKPEG